MSDEKADANEAESPTSKKHMKDGGAAQAQSRMDEINAKGYDGYVPDPTPNFNYSLLGNDEPTPETDEELHAEARKAAKF